MTLLNCPEQSHSPSTSQPQSGKPWNHGCRSDILRTKKEAQISSVSRRSKRVKARAADRKKKRCNCGSTMAAIGRHKIQPFVNPPPPRQGEGG